MGLFSKDIKTFDDLFAEYMEQIERVIEVVDSLDTPAVG